MLFLLGLVVGFVSVFLFETICYVLFMSKDEEKTNVPVNNNLLEQLEAVEADDVEK